MQSKGSNKAPKKRQRQADPRFAGAVATVQAYGPSYRPSLEKKNIDTTPLTTPAFATSTGSLNLINGCVANFLPTSRIGRRIHMTSVLLRGQINLSPTTTGTGPIRIMVVYDKQANKLAPAVTDIIGPDSASGVQVLANSRRFRVIRDLCVPCLGTAGPQCYYVNEYVKLKLETEYIDGAGAGTVADITSGALYCIVWFNAAFLVASLQTALTARVRFTDA